MDINKVLKELDELPGGENTYKTGEFLKEKIELASEEGDHSSELTLINEMIGYCRYTGRHEDTDHYARYALRVCKEQGLEDTLAYATTLLNIATAYRAAGRYGESLDLYDKVENLYKKFIDKSDYLYAALYNNMSLLYQAMEDNEKSAYYLENSLDIIDGISEEKIPQAITRTNLAQAYIRLKKYEDAGIRLKEAEEIFLEKGGDDFHYPGCLNAMAGLYYINKDYENSIKYYNKALELLKHQVGEDNPAYISVRDNLNEVKTVLEKEGIALEIPEAEATRLKGMDISRSFYEEYGKQMLKEKFPDYEKDITVGLVGRGSQCYGYDDELSTDHDFGPDFCMFVDDEIYYAIGDSLQEEYDKLPGEYMGYKRVRSQPPDGKRIGVMRTLEFYSNILDADENFLKKCFIACEGEDDKLKKEYEDLFFSSISEEHLSASINGEIFKAGSGDFIKIRKMLSYYPDNIWRKRIATELHYSAQMGQYNYIRMLKRGDKVASELALAGYMEHTMKLVYLINRKYAPYYKWLHHGMADLEKAAVIMDIFNAVYDMPKGDERIRMTIEIVAAIIIEELEKIGMAGNVAPEEKYLDVYSQVLMGTSEDNI
ncbi:MAG: DUF4037 domain-containing protein [Lachnospiraceae bacterium]|nr:DUF4037 domain-containing protein [Lachnospiraceae bacterium]